MVNTSYALSAFTVLGLTGMVASLPHENRAAGDAHVAQGDIYRVIRNILGRSIKWPPDADNSTATATATSIPASIYPGITPMPDPVCVTRTILPEPATTTISVTITHTVSLPTTLTTSLNTTRTRTCTSKPSATVTAILLPTIGVETGSGPDENAGAPNDNGAAGDGGVGGDDQGEDNGDYW